MTTKDFVSILEAFMKAQYAISEAWNGEDSTFTYEGKSFHEVDAHIAQDRAEAAQELLKVINEDDL